MAKNLCAIFGVILLLFGLVGFTSNALIGVDSMFAADTAHNLVHIILGGILLIVWFRGGKNSSAWLKVVGAVLLFLSLVGFLTVPASGGSLFGIAYSNGAADWLHFVLGIALVAAGTFGKSVADTAPGTLA